MNLEEYRNKEADREPESNGFISGFNTAIELDLPVKFVEWINKEGYRKLPVYESVRDITDGNLPIDKRWSKLSGYILTNDKDRKDMSSKELYQYWLDNVFKI